MNIRPGGPADCHVLLDIWLRSVRATHHFLSEADIEFFVPLVRAWLASDEPELWLLEAKSGEVMGFMGLSGNKLEALFLAPEFQRRGGGRRLVQYARRLKGELTVDVNEQNPSACSFYESCGFVVEGRSELDATGRPFPLLHLRLAAPVLPYAPPDAGPLWKAQIRREREGDRTAVHRVNVAAFETAVEADLVDLLRGEASPLISLVAEEEREVVGHILFSPVVLAGRPELRLMGLGPMGVLPERQRQGIGSALVEAGLAECRREGFDAVVVLGHPEYYSRFGFVPSAQFHLACEFPVPAEVFMVKELEPGCLKGATGVVSYHPAFGGGAPPAQP